MFGTRQNSLRLFQFRGIEVFLHWSWFLVAAYEIGDRQRTYSSVVWNILEYLALFLIVTIHEFGHALACRQVGGIADRIVLWPLGGTAYVNPPPRPGAMLWSIAAGPLVNVALIPVFWMVKLFMRSAGLEQASPDLYLLASTVAVINIVLLLFNLLPVYPLDGGQILRSLLWYPLGRARSLMAVAIIGFLGVAGMVLLAIKDQSAWWAVLALFVLMRCWNGLKQAKALLQLAKLPRHIEYRCPTCKSSPPSGEFWRCANCQRAFDTFQSQAVCPHCSTSFETTGCLDCGRAHPLREWTGATVAPPAL